MRASDMQFTLFFALGCFGIHGRLEVRRIRMFVPGLNKEQRTQPQRSRRRLESRKRGAFALGLVINGVFHGGILSCSLNVGVPSAVVFMILLNSSSSTTFPSINSFLGRF